MTTEFNDEKVRLSDEELEKLTRFFGYGPFEEADIVFSEWRKDLVNIRLKRFQHGHVFMGMTRRHG